MKKISLFAGLAVLGLSAISILAFRSAPAGPSANGQAGLMIGDQLQHFSFQARTSASGSVSGSFEVKSPTQELRLHGNISCLKVLADGKTAFMSGVVTQRVGDGFPGAYNVGDFVYFEVQDNGEGANASADKFSDLFPSGATQFCGTYSIGMAPIVNGNVQVKP